MNFLLVECLERYDYFFGDHFKVECPTGSGNLKRLRDVSAEIRNRLTRIFLPDENGRRPCHGDDARYSVDENWKDLVLFYEFFDGDTGRGCGARYEQFTVRFSTFERCEKVVEFQMFQVNPLFHILQKENRPCKRALSW